MRKAAGNARGPAFGAQNKKQTGRGKEMEIERKKGGIGFMGSHVGGAKKTGMERNRSTRAEAEDTVHRVQRFLAQRNQVGRGREQKGEWSRRKHVKLDLFLNVL